MDKSFALGPEMRSEGLWEGLGFRKIRSFYEITWIFGDCLCYEHFANNLYSKKKTTTTTIRIKGTQSKNKHGDPIFYLYLENYTIRKIAIRVTPIKGFYATGELTAQAVLRRLNMNFWWLFKFRTFCAQLGEKTLALRNTGTRRENKHGWPHIFFQFLYSQYPTIIWHYKNYAIR